MQEIAGNEGVKFVVDLVNQQLTTGAGTVISFEIDSFRKDNLLKGLDDIGLTLEHEDKISAFEANQKQAVPWLWA
jgi:3-isopropylmalate/(R)-2-methylmalate dehydratase small subunit